jgi:hypothetical protein
MTEVGPTHLHDCSVLVADMVPACEVFAECFVLVFVQWLARVPAGRDGVTFHRRRLESDCLMPASAATRGAADAQRASTA